MNSLASMPSMASAMSAVRVELSDADVRHDARDLSVSDQMKLALIEEEGLRTRVYTDVAGKPTVGVGHLVKPRDGLSVGETITQAKALDFLEQDLEYAEGVVADLVGDLPVTQHEFDALVDLAFNVGEGNLSERQSPRLNAAIETGDYQAIADELDYHYAGGGTAKGLELRSERRTAIFLDGKYENPREAVS